MADKISIIIPTYNEKDNITPLLSRVAQALAGYDYEILIVDDGSKDGTIELASELAFKYPVKVIVRRGERGLATAVVHGLKSATGQIIGVMDADLQHPPEVIPDLIKAIQDGADMVVASRYIPGGGCPNWGLSRRIISRVALMISHLLLPLTRQVKDPLAGFFMFRRQNVDPEKLRPIGYKISLEVMLIKFMLVGLSGVIVNEGVYWLLTRFGGLAAYDWLAVIIGIEVSIITNFILNDTFTFAKRRAGKSFMGRLLRFNLICIAGAAIQWGLFMLFTRLFGVYDLLSNFIGIVVAFLWNYSVNRNWTWR
jgi:dolichol-phosphate mannosyltransferase